MSPPVPPPDPPEYGPTRPPRGREDTGLGRVTTDLRSSVDSLQASIEQVLEHFSQRDRTSEVRRADSTITRAVIEDFVKAETQRRNEEAKRREKEEEAKARRARLLKVVSVIASFVTVVVLGIWEGCKMTRPQPPTIEAVQSTIEERTTALESNEKATTERVTAVEGKADQILSILGEMKAEAAKRDAPPPEPEQPKPRPKRPR